jgi:hypothetical protein
MHKQWPVLVVSGRVVLAISYGLAFIIGGIEVLTPTAPTNPVSSDVACDSTCKTQGALLLVPVAGPLLMIQSGPHNASDTTIGLVWSGIQAAGLAMLIVGLVGHDVPQAPFQLQSPAPAKVSVVPLVTPDGGALSLHVAW